MAVMTGSTPKRTELKMATGKVTKPMPLRKLVRIASSKETTKAKPQRDISPGAGAAGSQTQRRQLQLARHAGDGRSGDEEHERQRQRDVDHQQPAETP